MTPARHFIDERLASTWKEIDADFLLWQSRKKHPNVEFSGSVAHVYWTKTLDQHAASLTNAAFAAAREIAEDHRLDAVESAQAAGDAVENAFHRLLISMTNIDRSLRGQGFPDGVPKRDHTHDLNRCLKRLAARTTAEVDAAKARSSHSVALPLSADHGMLWFWIHANYKVRWALLVSAGGLLLSAATSGYFIGRNDSVRRTIDFFAAEPSKKDPIAQPILQPITAPKIQNADTSTNAPTTTHTNKSK